MDEQYESENKLIKKMKADPMVPIGLTGLTAVVLYKAYNFKNRGDTKPSVYLIHLRLAAQGTFIGSLTLALMYSIYKKHISKHIGSSEK